MKTPQQALESAMGSAVADAFKVYISNVDAEVEDADDKFVRRMTTVIACYGHALALLDEFLE